MRTINIEDLDSINYYQVPKWLMDLFLQGKISSGGFKTYVLMYDRLRLSSKNEWIDEEGTVYIKYSYDEMQEDLNCSRQAISNNLKDLLALDLIVKIKNYNSSSKFYLKIYDSRQENFTSKEKLTNSSQEILTNDSKEKLTNSSQVLLDANKNNFNKNNSSKNNYNKNNVREELELENISQDLKNKFIEYLEYRKQIKKPIKTYMAIKKTLNRLGKDFIDENHLIDSIDMSISNQYQGIFPTDLKKKRQQPQQESYATRKLRELEEREGRTNDR